MMTLEQVRAALRDRRAAVVAKHAGLRVATVIDIREGRVKNPAYDTVRRLSDYFEGIDSGAIFEAGWE
jgi:hypothetical protein